MEKQQKLTKAYESRGFESIGTGGGCEAYYLPLGANDYKSYFANIERIRKLWASNRVKKDVIDGLIAKAHTNLEQTDVPYILATDTGGLHLPQTAKDRLMLGIYNKDGEQVNYIDMWDAKPLTSSILFREIRAITKYAKGKIKEKEKP